MQRCASRQEIWWTALHKREVHTCKAAAGRQETWSTSWQEFWSTKLKYTQEQKGPEKEIWYVQSIVCLVTLIAFDVGHSWTQFAKRAHRSNCADFSHINICTASTSSKHTLSFLWHPHCAYKTPQSQNRLNATVKCVQPQALYWAWMMIDNGRNTGVMSFK